MHFARCPLTDSEIDESSGMLSTCIYVALREHHDTAQIDPSGDLAALRIMSISRCSVFPREVLHEEHCSLDIDHKQPT
jgi:hypothetical protein